MIELLDYILDYEDNFWIISAINEQIWGYIVYSVNEDCNRLNNITKKNYQKNLCTCLKVIPPYKRLFKPKKFYQEHKEYLTGVWKNYVNALNEIGINDSDIGIFGSYLIGFDIIKDVDFVIYGEENLNKYYENNELIQKKIKATFISNKHINYQYNKHKDNYSPKCDLKEIIGRNWSGVQICDGVLSTPRFITSDYRVPSYEGKKEVVKVTVLEGLTSSCFPRVASVLYNNYEYKMITPLWKYQAFAHKDDEIECLAIVDDEKKTIFLPTNDCYIKYLKKSNKVK